MTMPVRRRFFGPTANETNVREENLDFPLTDLRTENETRDGNAASRTGEKKSCDDENQVRRPESDRLLRSEGAEKPGKCHQKKTDAHDRTAAVLIGQHAEENRADHVTREENHLHRRPIIGAIANHRPLDEEKQIPGRMKDRRSLTSSTNVRS